MQYLMRYYYVHFLGKVLGAGPGKRVGEKLLQEQSGQPCSAHHRRTQTCAGKGETPLLAHIITHL